MPSPSGGGLLRSSHGAFHGQRKGKRKKTRGEGATFLFTSYGDRRLFLRNTLTLASSEFGRPNFGLEKERPRGRGLQSGEVVLLTLHHHPVSGVIVPVRSIGDQCNKRLPRREQGEFGVRGFGCRFPVCPDGLDCSRSTPDGILSSRTNVLEGVSGPSVVLLIVTCLFHTYMVS